jgi:ABC-2 type transport system permease protein
MKRYIDLFFALCRTSFIADLEYRANIVAKIVTDILWYVAQLSTFEVLITHTPDLAGWSIQELRFFMAILFLVDAVFMLLFSENMDQLPLKVANGELDLLLTKPVNSQFMVSLNKINCPYLVNIFVLVLWTIYVVYQLPQAMEPLRLALLIGFAMPVGLVVFYCMRFWIASLSLIFVRTDNLPMIFYQVYRFGVRPYRFYPFWLRVAVLTIIPVGFIAGVPAEIVLGELPIGLLLWGIALAALALLGTRKFWAFALTRYSSASS